MKKEESVTITKEMLEATNHGYKFMLELRLLMSIYGVKGFNERFGTDFTGLDDLVFNPELIK